jgi:hypothetical protein
VTTPTPAPTLPELDKAVLDAMRALAVARQANPCDPAAVTAARTQLVNARAARGYPSA